MLGIQPLRLFALCALLGPALACQAPAPAPAGDTDTPAKPASPAEPGATPAPSETPTPSETPAETTPEPSGAPDPSPPWFRPDAYEHVTIIKRDPTGTRLPSGELSAMLVLELTAGTTPEQCIEQARAKLGETIADLPPNSTTPQGYLQLQGKTDAFGYNIVCGLAKDKPTMFLSYIQ